MQLQTCQQAQQDLVLKSVAFTIFNQCNSETINEIKGFSHAVPLKKKLWIASSSRSRATTIDLLDSTLGERVWQENVSIINKLRKKVNLTATNIHTLKSMSISGYKQAVYNPTAVNRRFKYTQLGNFWKHAYE